MPVFNSPGIDVSNLSRAWTSAQASPTALKMNVASDSGATGTPLLLDLQYVSASKFKVAPTGDTSLASAAFLAWSTDLKHFRDAANVHGQRNGTAPQTFNIYDIWTDASNYGRLSIGSNGSLYFIHAVKAGSGALKQLYLAGGANTVALTLGGTAGNWNIQNSTGHFIAGTNNTYDIGASGATSPRSIYFGTSLFRGSTKILGAQEAAVADASGGAVIDAEARTALNALLARVRTHGLIAT